VVVGDRRRGRDGGMPVGIERKELSRENEDSSFVMKKKGNDV
jgi:hypothetical protein